MANLRNAMMHLLPPPQSPTRRKPLDAEVALRQLGFDNSFDLALQCKVDAISAVEDLARTCPCGTTFQDGESFCRSCCTDRYEVQRVRRLHFALQRLEAKQPRVSLPCACVRVSKDLAQEDKSGGKSSKKPDAKSPKKSDTKSFGDLSPEEAHSNLAEKISQAARVPAGTVTIEVVGEQLQCTVQISRLGASVVGIGEALASKKKASGPDTGDPFGIHKAFAEAGAVDDTKMTISPVWAKERVIEEVKLVHPDYVLEEERLNDLVQTAADSRASYDKVWQKIAFEEKDGIAALLSYGPMARFVGSGRPQVLSMEDAQANGLTYELPQQESNSLETLMGAAAQAHMQLKQALAPNSFWAQEFMCDLGEIPYEDERRRVTAGSNNQWDLVPGAFLVDLGLKPERRVFEKAKWQQRPEQMSPPLTDILDISHMLIVFEDCKELCAGLDRLMRTLDVISLENRFLDPLCMGHRCVMLFVKQRVGSQTHISKLILEHRKMFRAKEGIGANHFKRVRSLLSTVGVASRELANLQRIVLRELGCTKAQSIQMQEQELNRAVACANDANTLAEPDGAALAKRIMDEAAAQALAAGVPQMRVAAATASATAREVM